MGTIGWTTVGASVACLLAANADAALLFAGGNAVAGEGLVSTYQGDLGVTVETFGAGACGLTNGALEVFGNHQMGSGSVENRRRAPEGDTGCYFATSGVAPVSTVVFSFLNVPGVIDYLGFYWGSIDPDRPGAPAGAPSDHNEIRLLSRSGQTLFVVPSFGDPAVTGDDFLAIAGLPAYSSEYINFRFQDSEDFGFLQISTTNYAFELDHLTWGTSIFPGIVPGLAAVPAPAGLVLFGAGVLLLAPRRRRGSAPMTAD